MDFPADLILHDCNTYLTGGLYFTAVHSWKHIGEAKISLANQIARALV